jgi:hypothetical protein
MNERELLVDCLRRLNRAAIDYYLTGSMASNYWGIPRTTHDLDFVVSFPATAVKLIVAEFSGDYYLDEASVQAAFQAPWQFNAIDTRSALKVDFWMARPDPFAREMFARRVSVNIFGETAWIATAEDVILHKLIWNRITPSDRLMRDAAGVWAVQGGRMDRPYMERWADTLETRHDLDLITSGTVSPKDT